MSGVVAGVVAEMHELAQGDLQEERRNDEQRQPRRDRSCRSQRRCDGQGQREQPCRQAFFSRYPEAAPMVLSANARQTVIARVAGRL
jgi:hypothetical protein